MTMQRIDFLRRSRPSLVGWMLLCAGLTATTAALWVARGWEQQRMQVDVQARAAAEAAQNERRLAMQPIVPSADERRLQRIAPLLRQPWLPTLRLVESVTETPIYLTALSIDPANGNVRIDGEAPNFDAALGYSQVLFEPGVIGDAQLQSHEQGKEGQGSPLKFTVVAKWKPR
jgi:hypothetical protein